MLAGLRLAAVVAGAVLLLAPSAAAGDEPGQQEQQSSARVPDRSADFLFGRPKASIGLAGTWLFASAGSDVFDFVTRHLTLDRADFNAPGLSADVGVFLTPRLDVQVGYEHSRMAQASEYRALVDNRSNPIEQTTSLRSSHIFAGVRYALTPRGEAIGRLAWIPRRVVPYVGAGAGMVFYQFQQSGDFVDFVDSRIFRDVFISDGWAPSAHVLGGVDVKLHRGLYAAMQGRYTRASATLDEDFTNFEPIDLSGFRMSAGINLLF